MMLPAVYWFFKERADIQQHKFFAFATLMVFLGGLGSTLFHAFRLSPVFLLMDVLPSALLMLSLSVFFWLKILKKWWLVLVVLLPLFGLRFLLYGQLDGHLAINISYVLSGALVLIPLLLVLYRTRFNSGFAVLLSLILLALALLFRQLDIYTFEFLPQGTHFLWHLFSAGGSYFMLYYLYRLRLYEQKED
jgi:hemolysin III